MKPPNMKGTSFTCAQFQFVTGVEEAHTGFEPIRLSCCKTYRAVTALVRRRIPCECTS